MIDTSINRGIIWLVTCKHYHLS